MSNFEHTSAVERSKKILKQYWGFDDFRPLQEEIADSVIYGHDTLAVLPTGGGKSICFQVPGLARQGLTIVVSPLIALMEDQVNNLLAKGIKAGLITSAMRYREIDITLDNARFGKMDFLYTSPERLKTPLFIERCKDMNVQLIVVDEAHCISEWGHDFRPAYREIAQLRELHPKSPIIALTASATQIVQQDIIEQLGLKSPQCFQSSLERDNLSYKVYASENKLKSVLNFCKSNVDHTGIIYCQTRRSVKNVVIQLRAMNLSAGFYHGGLKPEDRKYMLDNWMSGNIKIMVATNAFGMGIDKPNVRYVLHFEIPNNLEAYYQEAGRAGRDGDESQVIAYWESKDIELMRDQLSQKYPSIEKIKLVYNSVCNHLKIAIGAGDQETYDFDIKRFSTSFELQNSEVYYSLKMLQLNETLSFLENSFHPTRLKFAVGNSALYKFQVTHDSVSNLISLLTRSYPGIFDRFINVDDSELSKRLKITRNELNDQLKFLEQYGVIDINFQSLLPKITMLRERLPDGHLILSPEVYAKRRKVEEDKLSSIIEYVTTQNCRSEMICKYFDSPQKKCGKCDVCLAEKNSAYSFKELEKIISELLPASSVEIANRLSIDAELTQRVLQNLLLEEKIIYKNETFELR